MKKIINKVAKLTLTLVLLISFTISPMNLVNTYAASFRAYNSATDIDYTDGEGKGIVLTHQKKDGGSVVASYEVDDTRLTRNATYYMSMKAKFSNSESWVIRLRNVTCKMGAEMVTGDMQFHLFDKKGTLQVAGKSIDNWPTFSSIEDNKWHDIAVRSTTDSFEIWVDGVRGQGLYYKANVTDMTTNYTCPAITLSGYNDGTVKDICVWNDGEEENPVMPADRVARQIESLPDAVSLKASDQKKVQEALAAYESLDAKEKTYVINYDKLQQLVKAQSSSQNQFRIEVSGNKVGAFDKLFSNGVVSHREKDGNTKYFFETEVARNATYYIQFVVNLSEESNCFDVYLRDQKHTVEGKDVSGAISLRMFKNSAVVVDSGQNRISEWANYKTNLLKGSHVITIESSPKSCVFWIDETKYEVPQYLYNVSGTLDCIQATTGFYFSKTVEGTISDISVWSNQNSYSVGDEARIAIFNLPELSELSEDSEKVIRKARKLYDELKEKQQKYVTNLEKLEKAERALDFIKEKGSHAYLFLKDKLPSVEEDYVNLISTATPDVPASHSKKVSYNLATHDFAFNESGSYITVPFTGIKGINADDTYLIKFTYVPHEYYYEKASSAWMGLRITFAGYEVGGNGQKTVNKTQFAFMTNQCALISRANSNAMPTEYLTTYVPELEKEYHVSMLCEQGRMKVWVNGEAVAYYDEIPEYPLGLEFESSRCRCDVKNIQLYNINQPTSPPLEEVEAGGFKYIEDTLYDIKGISAQGRVEQKMKMWVVAMILLFVIVVVSAVVLIVNLKNKEHHLKIRGEGAANHDKKENC